jgi:hypothetical protein
MDGFDARATAAATYKCRGTVRAGQQRRRSMPWSALLTIATGTAILLSGLNALVQIVKVAIEYGYAHWG